MNLRTDSFGKTSSGDEVKRYTCTNEHGNVIKLIDYGAIVVAVEMPDRDGIKANVTLGFEELNGYFQRHPYFGATVGRFCNRIAKGNFNLNGKRYELAINNDPNHLHGGEIGFDRHLWTTNEIVTKNEVGIKFSRTSPDGEEGYPGNLKVTASYTLSNENELKMEFTAQTDSDTVLNLTNHNYWNLSGAGTGDILDHELTIHADRFLEVDPSLIPTGKLIEVQGTPLDFRSARRIGDRIQQIKADPIGYDHCYALPSQDGTLSTAAVAKDPESGRVMEVKTTQPGLQFYSGNFLDGSDASGHFSQHSAFCLETQHFPDSPNQAHFPTTVLKPSQTFKQTTIHRFYIEQS